MQAVSPLDPAIWLIRKFEGCRLGAYKDRHGHWAIGYGTTSGVFEGMAITKDKALELMLKDLQDRSWDVHMMCTVDVSNNELCAMTSLAYNIGLEAFRNSELLKKLNSGAPKTEVAEEFLRWVHSEGEILKGLVNRRQSEMTLFLN